MKQYIIAFILIFSVGKITASVHKVSSPDNIITVEVKVDKDVSYSVLYNDKSLLLSSSLSMELSVGNLFGLMPKVVGSEIKHIDEVITPVLKLKRSHIPDLYTELTLSFETPVDLQFRVYNDGVAYRFITRFSDDVIIVDEKAAFRFVEGSQLIYSETQERTDVDKFHSSFEEPYNFAPVDSISSSVLAFSPVLIHSDNLPYMVITESDVYDYPGMFLTGNGQNSLFGKFANAPLREVINGGEFKVRQIVERAPYIAKTKGDRTFPWRVILIEENAGGLLKNDLVYRLAPEPDFTDFSWIKPGKSTEEWITGLNLYGVDFESGLNTATYKYYIDFSARFGFEYVMLDAGWSDVNDLFKITPEMDMEEITGYAKEKGVGLILWTQALTIERQMKEAFEQFKKWDIKIVMTDFIDRDDQKAINFMHKFAAACAENKFMCMIHGAPKPAGFSRTWPNMLTREGALGSEYNIWSVKANPDHDLLIPFIRMTSGPMDYEPGILQNATKEQTAKMGFEKVIAQGTRMHQIAMFVVYESPLQLFSGNLSDAVREPELMTFLGKIPTVWDETKILEAKLGEYIVEVRQNGEEWFLAAMNNWTPKEFTIPTNFLPAGEYIVEIAGDGINAAKNPHDYYIKRSYIKNNDTISIKLAPGGGYVARIYKSNKN